MGERGLKNLFFLGGKCIKRALYMLIRWKNFGTRLLPPVEDVVNRIIILKNLPPETLRCQN
jgi:hypothetical protein